MTRRMALTQSSMSDWEFAMSRKDSWLMGARSFSPVPPAERRGHFIIRLDCPHFWKSGLCQEVLGSVTRAYVFFLIILIYVSRVMKDKSIRLSSLTHPMNSFTNSCPSVLQQCCELTFRAITDIAASVFATRWHTCPVVHSYCYHLNLPCKNGPSLHLLTHSQAKKLGYVIKHCNIKIPWVMLACVFSLQKCNCFQQGTNVSHYLCWYVVFVVFVLLRCAFWTICRMCHLFPIWTIAVFAVTVVWPRGGNPNRNSGAIKLHAIVAQLCKLTLSWRKKQHRRARLSLEIKNNVIAGCFPLASARYFGEALIDPWGKRAHFKCLIKK